MPETWRGKASDRQLVAWVHDYDARRTALPPDPGPGAFKRSFRLSASDMRLVKNLAAGDLSSWLRRLIAFHVGSPQLLPAVAARNRVAVASPARALVGSNPLERGLARKPPAVLNVAFSPVDNRLPSRHASPVDVPPILVQPCPENNYSPMLRDGQWMRSPRTPEEDRAYRALLEARMQVEQRRGHAWEISVGAVCTCGPD